MVFLLLNVRFNETARNNLWDKKSCCADALTLKAHAFICKRHDILNNSGKLTKMELNMFWVL